MRLTRLIPFALLLAFAFVPSAARAQCAGGGAAFSCASGSSVAQIQAAWNAMSGGGTVTLAAGSYNFNSHFDMAQNTGGGTLICATAPLTIGAATTNQCAVTVTSFFGLSQINNAPAGGTNNNLYRVSGFQIIDPAFNTTIFWIESGCAHYGTACTGTLGAFRFDHNTVDQSGESVTIYISDIFSYVQVYGVIDHNIIKSSSSWGGSAGDGGILQWVGGTNPTDGASQLGTGNNLFVETNTIDFSYSGVTDNGGFGIIDSWGGAAIVARYNTSVDGLWTAHAVTHGGGYSNLEFYGNNVSMDAGAVAEGFQDCYRCFHSQGADTNIFWNNTFTPYSGHSGNVLDLTSYRDYAYGAGGTPGGSGASVDGSFPACDGTQSFDGNRSGQYGYPCWHQPGRAPNGTYQPTYAWNNRWSDGTSFVNNGGNSFSTFGGTPPPSCTPQPAGTCEYWDLHMVANRDYYEPVSPNAQSNATTPFNGSTGVGFGTLANRPTTCTTSSETAFGHGAAGVGYFATDQGPQGTLYACVATNTWAVFYTPFTYPHPLVGGGPPQAPNPPTNLTGVVN
jgi:hypothetical protein